MIEKSKRVEEDLSRWDKVVIRNKKQSQNRMYESIKLIQDWNDKLSDSSSRKNARIESVSRMLEHKSVDRIRGGGGGGPGISGMSGMSGGKS